MNNKCKDCFYYTHNLKTSECRHSHSIYFPHWDELHGDEDCPEFVDRKEKYDEIKKDIEKFISDNKQILNIQNNMLGIGKNVYIVLDNKLKFDAHNVMEHWYAQDDIIIRCPIIGVMFMEDGTKLYNIKINGDIYQIPCYDSYCETKKSNDLKCINQTTEGTTVVKYGKLEVNPNGDYQEVLTNTDYFAFYDYKDAVKRFRWLFKFRFMKIKDELDNLIKNMNMAIDYLDDDISVDTDEYNEAVKKSYGDKYGYTEG